MLRLRGSARAISRVPFCALEGHEVVAEHEVDGDGAEEVVIDGAFAQVDEFAAVAGGDGLGLGDFGGGGGVVDADVGERGFEGGRHLILGRGWVEGGTLRPSGIT